MSEQTTRHEDMSRCGYLRITEQRAEYEAGIVKRKTNDG